MRKEGRTGRNGSPVVAEPEAAVPDGIHGRELLRVLTAFKRGDFSVRMPSEQIGLAGKIADTLNEVLELNERMTKEFDRINRSVGKEGKINQRASIGVTSGSWTTCVEAVNGLVGDLVQPSTEVARVIGAVANGDLSQTMAVDADGRPLKGEFLRTARVVNTMVEQLNSFASEVTRVAREVGTEGKLGGQAVVTGVAGTWKDLTESVNSMASNLTNQVRNIAGVTTAVARGDLTTKITVDARGEILELKNTMNTMVDQLSSFASEVTRVAREVGTEGKLGGQADVRGVGGVWKDLTDSVNSMAGNLTAQVRNIAAVTTAVANGDLSRKITVDVRGEILELKNTINTMVDQLNGFASEVTRVAREVGTEGKLGGQADVKGVGGTWKDLTDSVNSMAGNLTGQVRNIAEVTTAVARGDLSRKITVDVRGEILELKNTINTMVDQLSSFASEVTRVAREVGTDGKLGGQANVRGVAGTWKDLTDSVNFMAGNLTAQVRNIAEVTTAVARGDLSRKITVDVRGEILELKNTINTMVDQLNAFASEVTRVAREVGTEGKLGGQADVRGVAGTWKDLTDSVNSMAGNLTNQVRNIAEVTTAVARGDLSRKITVDVRGEILELKNTINTMVDQLNAFASEVTRVAREVGTEGKLGGQADVKGVGGTWKDLTDSVNSMAGNLTGQVRNIAAVTTAVANGDLSRKITVDVRGEILELKNTINTMVDQLNAFASEVTRVAREVGTEGKLGGQADVKGVAGVWKDLTDSVNQLAANLTTQVRAIAEVATAVTKGDLTRSITVGAQGEVAALKDNINEMIINLKETTRKNTEQDWLKTNVARFTNMLQGQRDLTAVARMILSELAPLVNAQHGVFYVNQAAEGEPLLRLLSSYAYRERKTLSNQFHVGEGLVGQCALEKERILLTEVPPDYIKINSGLGEATPLDIIVLPVLFEGEVKAVVELASFLRFSEVHLAFLDQLTQSMGIVLNTIEATMRTEQLLAQSQALAEELKSQQKELTEGNKRLEAQAHTLQASEELLRTQQEQLQQTNLALQEKARQLAEQNVEVERKNREVELAKQALEDKADQLALTSKYKSEFLANMSHELRTPLNSLLILAQMLADNSEGKLSPKQVKFAQTIYQSGVELLSLINDILDLSKVESGMTAVDLDQVFLSDLQEYANSTFRHVADEKNIGFETALGPDLPKTIYTDPKRLQQVLKNLLSNALKFTEQGKVTFRIERATNGWSPDHPVLNRSESVIAFVVKDTGIGIPEEQQSAIFEAFRQADGTTSRKYGGTGLGLSISRELTRLLGGQMSVQSNVGEGSTFTLYLPASYIAASVSNRESQPITQTSELRRSAPATAPPRAKPTQPQPPTPAAPAFKSTEVTDDRDTLKPGEKRLLIVEDDPRFAQILCDLARERDLKCMIALRGDKALTLAQELKPDAITLDIRLPDMAGWTLLDRLKHDPRTRHIPVHVISIDEDRQRGLSLGAKTYLEKSIDKGALLEVFAKIRSSVERNERNLLVVEHNEEQRQRLLGLIAGSDVQSTFVASTEEALSATESKQFDCVVVGFNQPGMKLLEFISKLQERPGGRELPVIVYTGDDILPEDEARLKEIAKHSLVRAVRSTERLLEETALFLHRVEANIPEDQRRVLEHARHNKDTWIAGGKILIIDDDVRNIFALTSVLERHKMKVVYAESGREALEVLKSTPGIELVLMDIMMPEMDGYQTTRAIRQLPQFRSVPIIALTAKAMKGDREKCIEAGASDYITKPVNLDDLIWLLRAWLPRVSEHQ